MDLDKIKPGLMVHAKGDAEMGGVPGEHVGTVDHLEGDKYIKLKRSDSSDGKHHWLPVDLVKDVDSNTVFLKCDEREFEERLIDFAPEPSANDSRV